jgi:hypothetical protein
LIGIEMKPTFPRSEKLVTVDHEVRFVEDSIWTIAPRANEQLRLFVMLKVLGPNRSPDCVYHAVVPPAEIEIRTSVAFVPRQYQGFITTTLFVVSSGGGGWTMLIPVRPDVVGQ